MKKSAILFVDIDDNATPSYYYREPHFIAAREMGLSCLIATIRNRKSVYRLFEDSDEVFFVDTLSVENILQVVYKSSEHYHIKAVFCYAGHASLHGYAGNIVSKVCQKLHFPYSTADALTACNNKFLMRHQLARHKINSVAFALCHDINTLKEEAERIGYPLIFKPPFGAGSSFIKKCKSQTELITHYALFKQYYFKTKMATFYGKAHNILQQDKIIDHYIPGKSVLLEQYADGIEGTVECVVYQKKVYPILINEKLILTEMSGTFLENLLITPPVSFSPSEIEQIKHYAIDCIGALGIENDIVHLEFRLSKQGPVVIEVNPRLGGLYVDLAFHDTANINPYKLYLSMLLQEKNIPNLLQEAITRTDSNCQHYSMMVIYPAKSGYFQGFSGIEYITNNPLILAYGIYPSGTYINAEIEENYLLKCWVKVNNKEHALNIYNNILQNVIPTLTEEMSSNLESI